MLRLTSIRENWKVKEQGCHKDWLQIGGSWDCGSNVNKELCPSCKLELKATYEENLKEAESMLETLDCIISDLAETLNCYSEGKFRRTTQEEANEDTLKWIVNLKAEWQKLRDEIKLKLEELK